MQLEFLKSEFGWQQVGGAEFFIMTNSSSSLECDDSLAYGEVAVSSCLTCACLQPIFFLTLINLVIGLMLFKKVSNGNSVMFI